MKAPSERSSITNLLQRGRARPRAEIVRGLRSRLPSLRASTGPRASARGNPRSMVTFASCRHVPASTGPRASARGNAVDAVQPSVRVVASTGPRASARGNLDRDRNNDSFHVSLQRGRARPRAEMRRLRAARYDRGASTGPRASARGNPLRGDGLAGGGDASTGPRASARGNLANVDNDTWPTVPASTGPRASARGNQRNRTYLTNNSLRFNGAARVRARK